MSLRYIVLNKRDGYDVYHSDYLWSDLILDSLFFAFSDLIVLVSSGDLQEWLLDDDCLEKYGNIAKLKKVSGGLIGLGAEDDFSDEYELDYIHQEVLVPLFRQWEELSAQGYKRLVLVRDNKRIWFCEYEKFNNQYGLALDKPFTLDVKRATEGIACLNPEILQGPFLVTQRILEVFGERLEIIQNRNNKYGLVRILTERGFIERSAFLWAWSLDDLGVLFDNLMAKHINRFRSHRIYWQGVLTIMNDDGYAITMVLDYAKQEIIAMYPARSNFYF